MTLESVIVELLLVAVVIRQLRGRRITAVGLLWPLALVAYAAWHYLPSLPSGGADGLLVAVCGTTGVALGAACAALTSVEGDGASIIARASVPAAVLWVLGVSARLAFGLVAEHGGGPSIAAFSSAHHLTIAGWTTALLAMSMAEVVVRSAGIALQIRGRSPIGARSGTMHR